MSSYTIEIEQLANGGDGVGHLPDGRVAFVPLSAPGDTVLAQIVDDRDTYVRARIEEITAPSQERVDPPCPYFGHCGGCQWQHVTRDAQLAAKSSAAVDAITRIAHLDAGSLVAECLAPSSPLGYRNKVDLRVDTSGPKLELGFTRRDSGEVVPIDECLLMPETRRGLIKSVRGALRFILGREKALVDRVAIRTATNSKDVQIALWTPPSAFPRAQAGQTLEQATGANSIVRVISEGSAEKRRIKNVERLAGKAWWSERLAGRRLSASAAAFFQVNTAAAEQLVELVLSAADVEDGDLILDLYAGVGTFTLPLAGRAAVAAVESSKWALGDLRHNLERAGLQADVMGGDAAYALQEIHSCDVAVVDPPRVGLADEVIGDLTALEPRRIVYVSCDAATFARDIGRFDERGYTLSVVTPIDLFPNTYHTELVATLAPRP
jgi:23S rRNA (uracil1939-C5)-methyltransferase